jgi:hypothetical protein
MKKGIEPLSTQRPQSFFLPKAKNTNHFVDISSSLRPQGSLRVMVIFSFRGTIFFSVASAEEDQKMPEEEAESAEVVS